MTNSLIFEIVLTEERNFMLLFIVEGESTDGTYIGSYIQSCIVAAKCEQNAIFIAYKKGRLLGDWQKWGVKKIGIALESQEDERVLEEFWTRDY